MTTQRIILANNSRLVREMLNRIFLKASNLEVTREIDDKNNLAEKIENAEAEWVILSLSSESEMPKWVDNFLNKHPQVRFLAVSPDGSQVKLKSVQKPEKHFINLSLNDLLYILEKQPVQLPA